jgi:hypothetical protein
MAGRSQLAVMIANGMAPEKTHGVTFTKREAEHRESCGGEGDRLFSIASKRHLKHGRYVHHQCHKNHKNRQRKPGC